MLCIPVIHQTEGRCILRHYKENNAIPATSNNSSITISFRAGSGSAGRLSHARRQTSSSPSFGRQRSSGEGGNGLLAGLEGARQRDLCYANPCIPTVGLDWSRRALSFFVFATTPALLTSGRPTKRAAVKAEAATNEKHKNKTRPSLRQPLWDS